MRVKKGSNLTLYAGQYAGDDTIPATPTAFYLRHTTGESLEGTTAMIMSDEIIPGRSRAEPMQGNSSNGGSIPIELSALSYDRMLSAVMMANWVQDGSDAKIATLNSSTLAKKLWILKVFSESDYPVYQLFKKVMVDSIELTFAINAITKGTFSLIGVNDPLMETSNPVSGLSSLPSALTTKAFTSRSGSITIDGVELTYMKEAKISLKNNLAALYALFQAEAIETAEKLFDITGTITPYLKDEVIFNKAVNGTPITLGITVEDDAGNSYLFGFTNVKLTTHTGASANSVDEISPAYDFKAFGNDVVTITRTLASAKTVYTLTYNGNSQTTGTAPDPVTKNEEGALLYASTNSGSLAKTGFTFDGWNTAAAGTGTSYAVGDPVVIEGATTLYAKWTMV